MIVRELLTKLGFSFDDSGLKKAEKAIDQFKQKISAIQKNAAKVKIQVDTDKARSQLKSFSESLNKASMRPVMELNLKTEKARAAISALSKEVTRSFGSNALRVPGGSAGVERYTRTQAAQVDSLTASIKRAAAAWLTYEGAKKAANVLDETQNIEARLSLLPQITTDAGTAFDFVADRATAARTSIEGYGKLFTRLGNAGKEYLKTQEDVAGITDTISKALVVSGATVKESESVMLQFSQAIGSTVLQGEEFKALAEASPLYLEQLSIALNIPRENLKEMAKEGKLTSKVVIEATKKMADYFDERFKKMPMTIGQSFTIISNKFEKMMAKFNRDSGFVKDFTDLVLSGADKIETAANKMVKAFGSWDAIMRVAGATLAVYFGAKALKMVFALNAATALLAIKFALIAAAIAAVALLIEDFYVYTQGGKSMFGDLLPPWKEVKLYASAFFDMVKDGVMWAVNLFVGLGKVIMGALGILTGNQDSVAMFKEGASLLFDVFAQAFNALGMAAKNLFSGLFDSIYKSIFEPMTKAMNDAWAWFKSLPSRAFSAATDFLGLGSGGASSMVTPSSIAGAGRGPVSNTTNVTVTVPEGTPAAQVDFLKQSAKKTFQAAQTSSLGMDYTIYAP